MGSDIRNYRAITRDYRAVTRQQEAKPKLKSEVKSSTLLFKLRILQRCMPVTIRMKTEEKQNIHAHLIEHVVGIVHSCTLHTLGTNSNWS